MLDALRRATSITFSAPPDTAREVCESELSAVRSDFGGVSQAACCVPSNPMHHLEINHQVLLLPTWIRVNCPVLVHTSSIKTLSRAAFRHGVTPVYMFVPHVPLMSLNPPQSDASNAMESILNANFWSESVSPEVLGLTPKSEIARQEAIFGV